jgi:hypothetical protein
VLPRTIAANDVTEVVYMKKKVFQKHSSFTMQQFFPGMATGSVHRN